MTIPGCDRHFQAIGGRVSDQDQSFASSASALGNEGESSLLIPAILLALAATGPQTELNKPISSTTPPSLFDRAATRVIAAVPEAHYDNLSELRKALSPGERNWFDRLSSERASEVALLVLISYSLPERPARHPGANTLLAAVFLAAQVAAGGASTGSSSEHVLDTGGPPRPEPARAGASFKATRAMAWARRLGMCDAEFVDALGALPPPAAGGAGEPDLRPAARDLGMLRYPGHQCTSGAAQTFSVQRMEK